MQPLVRYDLRNVYEISEDHRWLLLVFPDGTLKGRPDIASEPELSAHLPDAWTEDLRKVLEPVSALNPDKDDSVDDVDGISFPIETFYRVSTTIGVKPFDFYRHQFLETKSGKHSIKPSTALTNSDRFSNSDRFNAWKHISNSYAARSRHS